MGLRKLSKLSKELVSSRSNPLPDYVICLILLLVSSAFAYSVLDRLGVFFLILVAGGLIIIVLLAYLSMKELSYALMLWILSMAGFRTLGMVRMPVLPDFSFDRLLLIWIVMMFIFRVIIGRDRLKGPYTADIVILLHTVYIFVQIQYIKSEHFHFWVLSSFSPLFAFLYGKYIINRDKELRNIFIFFLLVTIYFYMMSIAQFYDWKSIIWPKSILDRHVGLWHRGRSRGPILHPPLFGQLLGMLLLVHFLFIAKVKRAGITLFLFLSLSASFMGQLFTYTRGPWLATAIAMGVMALLRPNYRKVIVVIGIIVFIGGIVGAIQLADTEFLQERLKNTDTIDNRLGFLVNAFRMVRDHPLFGVGYFRFNEYRGHYNQAAYIPFYGFIKKKAAAHVPIHDIYLGRLAEEGMISSILQFAFYILILRAFVKKWRANPRGKWFNRDTMALMAAIMVCYLVGGMIIDYRYFDMVNVIFYLLAGLVYGYPVEKSEETLIV